MNNILTSELAKAGIASLILGSACFLLWNKTEASEKESRKYFQQEIIEIKKENKICTNNYHNLLVKKINETNEIINKTNVVIEKNTEALRMIIKKSYNENN